MLKLSETVDLFGPCYFPKKHEHSIFNGYKRKEERRRRPSVSKTGFKYFIKPWISAFDIISIFIPKRFYYNIIYIPRIIFYE